ncbi:MAG: M48 family metalloprotease, partial [Deltaproteobacteria bacterium]|nr:M48 family metalloprotease [Deltaproteobacteria bacterium]
MLVKKSLIAVLIFMLGLGSVLTMPVCAITITDEEKLGRQFIKEVRRYFDLVTDAYIDRYINELGQRLLKAFPPQQLTYHFYVINQPVFNAFAGPGGHVFINSGLLEAMDSDAELAGILGHEIAHVSSRHISQKIGRAGKIQMVTLAGLVAGILLGAGGGGDVASALTVGSLAAGQSLSLAYS